MALKWFELEESNLAAVLPGSLQIRKGNRIGPEEKNVLEDDTIFYSLVDENKQPLIDGYVGEVVDKPFIIVMKELANREDILSQMNYKDYEDMKAHLDAAYGENLSDVEMTIFKVSPLTKADGKEYRIFTPG